ncbi:MAG: cobalamin biosynthesis protein CbiG [Rhodospirillales bacterium]|nr:cobalamin biosynthesis protein CbiG [Rhodospirillales bacterium]
MVDWSAAAVPASGADSIWIAASERIDGVLPPPRLVNTPTRREAMAFLADQLADLVARDRTVLAGFDFAFGYPGGFARMLHGAGADWRAVWSELALRIRDGDDNSNNRFAVATALNEQISGKAFPFWGCPPQAAGPLLSTRKPAGFANDGRDGLAELRLCDRAAGGPHPVWKLAYPGCVGSQTLMGIAHLHALRQHPWLNNAGARLAVRNRPAPLQRPASQDWRVLLAEIYPSIFDHAAVAHPVKDARQVQAVVEQPAASTTMAG